jgi:hypothetical protein
MNQAELQLKLNELRKHISNTHMQIVRGVLIDDVSVLSSLKILDEIIRRLDAKSHKK